MTFSVGLLAATVTVLPAGAAEPTVQYVIGMRSLEDVWCRPDGTCVAVGRTKEGVGAVVVLRPGGPLGPVRTATVPGTSRLSGIACAPGGGCTAVGQGGGRGVVVDVSPDGTPGTVRAAVGSVAMFKVACPTATTCLATGTEAPVTSSRPTAPVFAVIENGQPAPAQRFPRGTQAAIGISCPSATRCLTVGWGSIGVLTNVNGTWSARVVNVDATLGEGLPTESISCPPSSGCIATAVRPRYSAGADYIFAVPAIVTVSPEGAAGPARTLRRDPGEMADVSCVAAGTCTVVGVVRSSEFMIVDLVGGVPVAVTTSSQPLYESSAVSCVAAASCGVVISPDLGDAVFLWHGPVPALR